MFSGSPFNFIYPVKNVFLSLLKIQTSWKNGSIRDMSHLKEFQQNRYYLVAFFFDMVTHQAFFIVLDGYSSKFDLNKTFFKNEHEICMPLL